MAFSKHFPNIQKCIFLKPTQLPKIQNCIWGVFIHYFKHCPLCNFFFKVHRFFCCLLLPTTTKSRDVLNKQKAKGDVNKFSPTLDPICIIILLLLFVSNALLVAGTWDGSYFSLVIYEPSQAYPGPLVNVSRCLANFGQQASCDHQSLLF